jgi:hypothetical protein
LKNLLDHEFESMDFDGVVSYREYFKELLRAVWLEEEGFDGKRPFGNSGWQCDPIDGLIEGGFAKTEKQAEKLILKMIEDLCSGS